MHGESRDIQHRHGKRTRWQDLVSRRTTGNDCASCPQASSRCCEHTVHVQLEMFQLRSSRCCEHTCLVQPGKKDWVASVSRDTVCSSQILVFPCSQPSPGRPRHQRQGTTPFSRNFSVQRQDTHLGALLDFPCSQPSLGRPCHQRHSAVGWPMPRGLKLKVLFAFLVAVMMVTACRRGGECPHLQRRRCLFGHPAEEAAAALLVGSEAPRDDVLELAAEVQGLRRVV